MLARRIIPCLDVKDGRVVKGTHFVNLKDAGDPVEIASLYSKEGADEIVFLDITATIENRDIILKIVEKTAEQVFIPLTVGGGIKGIKDITLLLQNGADKVSINTAAVKNPKLIKESAERFGSQCIVVAIDAKKNVVNKNCTWEVYINAGKTPTSIDVIKWAKTVEEMGAGEILLTSIDADGTNQGYDIELTKIVSETVNIPVIASGGAGTPEHIYEVLTIGKADAALTASILHYGKYTIKDIKQYLKNKNIPVRI
jgi:cyclase